MERSRRELEQFVRIVAHDLNEPLRSIGAFTQLIAEREKDRLSDESREFMGFVLEGVDRLRSRIAAVRRLADVSATPCVNETVEVAEVLSDVVAGRALTIQAADAKVQWDSLPAVVADRSRLILVLDELIGNALRFRSDESPKIQIWADEMPDNTTIHVKDNGVGIDASAHDRIFLLFQRLGQTRESPGVGVGLTLCRKILSLHNGDIWVQSEPGRGATFSFRLPNRDTDQALAEIDNTAPPEARIRRDGHD